MTLTVEDQKVLDEVSKSSEQLDRNSKLYMADTTYRRKVDDADKTHGTNLGRELKQHFLTNGVRHPDAPAAVVPPTELELAAALEKFPMARCRELFLREASEPGESVTSLTKEDYRQAKIAARFRGISLPDNGAETIRFNYTTKHDREAARAAKAAAAAPKPVGETIPPGLEKSPDGIGYLVVDPVAHQAWREKNTAEAKAHEVIQAALKEKVS
jgi:hypothetical protein